MSASSVFQDDTFAVQNVVDNTKEVMLNCSGISTVTTRTMSIQDASGTIAYLSDIPTFPTTFLDDAFTVINALDNSKEVMLNCSQIATGATRVMTVQDADGTIAYLSDLANTTGPPFADDEFTVFAASALASQTELDVSGVSANTTIVMTVQNRDGVIAYLSDILQVVEIFVNTSRSFPDVGNEGVANLTALGDLTHIEITLCGAGGGGGGTTDGGPGAGGGGGSAIENFLILEPDDKFSVFNVTIGVGGTAAVGMGDGGNGGNTMVEGISSTGFFVELTGYGGGGGEAGGNTGGGAGGGGGGAATDVTPGVAGTLGGLVGGSGAVDDTGPDATRGAFKLPWRSGSGGGAGDNFLTPVFSAAAWQGGFAVNTAASIPEGAASMFGPGGTASGGSSVTPGLCAGGGGAGAPAAQDGGDGVVVFRYYTQ